MRRGAPRRGAPPLGGSRPTPELVLAEADPNPAPEVVVVVDRVDVVEEQSAFTDEVHRPVRIVVQRDAEVQQPRRRERLTPGEIPERDARADERVVPQVLV